MMSHLNKSRVKATLLSILCLLALAVGQPVYGGALELKTTAKWLYSNEVELLINVRIEPGLHIYGIDQAKPILATKIQVGGSDSIVSSSDFEAVTPPERRTHEILGVEVLEHFGSAQWRSRLVVRDGAGSFTIHGSLFAQVCEDEKCFPPESLTFSIELAALDKLPLAQVTSKQLVIVDTRSDGSTNVRNQGTVPKKLSVHSPANTQVHCLRYLRPRLSRDCFSTICHAYVPSSQSSCCR